MGSPYYQVGCNRCIHCKIRRRKEWTIRLLHEQASNQGKPSTFITLTYDEDHVPKTPTGLNTLRPADLTNYFKALRRRDEKFKYYACGEYGEEYERPHYHALLFGAEPEWEDVILNNIERGTFKEAWKYGNQYAGQITAESIGYTAGYIDKKIYGKKASEHYQDRTPEYQVSSNGIGLQYLTDHAEDIVYDNELTYQGKRYPMPRYYIEKITGDLKHKFSKDQLAIFEQDRREAKRQSQAKQHYQATGEELAVTFRITPETWDSNLQISKDWETYLESKQQNKPIRRRTI